MNGLRIEPILGKDPKCGPMFLGVYPYDRLPKRFKTPALLVCNTGPPYAPGEHWVVLYVENSSYGEYFDSFGRPPDAPFRTFLDVNCNYWIFNDWHLHVQSAINRFCGHYCIFYCLHRCRGYNVNAIINKLTLDTGLNDYLIHQYVCYNKLLK